MKRRKFIRCSAARRRGRLQHTRNDPSRANRRTLHRNRGRESFQKELREGLRELGYVEGQNIAFVRSGKKYWLDFLTSRPSLSG